jgi:hypothetical protein
MVEVATAGKAAQLASKQLGDALRQTEQNRTRARVAARIVDSELERVDVLLQRALNLDIWQLSSAAVEITAWKDHRATLAELLDNETWAIVDSAVGMDSIVDTYFRPPPGKRGAKETLIARQAAWEWRIANVEARASLVRYTAKIPLWKRLVPYAASGVRGPMIKALYDTLDMPADLAEMAESAPASEGERR